MAELIEPHPRFHTSFLAAMAEQQDWLTAFVDGVDQLADRDGFERYVAALISHRTPGPHLPEGFVTSSTLWWVEGDTYLGRVSIRHRLNDRLRNLGGHIGYWMRPSARRQGHATAAFAASLDHARGLGIECVLVTCDHDNHASRRIIEGAGGLFERALGEKRLYWVPAVPVTSVPIGDLTVSPSSRRG